MVHICIYSVRIIGYAVAAVHGMPRGGGGGGGGGGEGGVGLQTGSMLLHQELIDIPHLTRVQKLNWRLAGILPCPCCIGHFLTGREECAGSPAADPAEQGLHSQQIACSFSWDTSKPASDLCLELIMCAAILFQQVMSN